MPINSVLCASELQNRRLLYVTEGQGMAVSIEVVGLLMQPDT